jgi:hypothetical protein
MFVHVTRQNLLLTNFVWRLHILEESASYLRHACPSVCLPVFPSASQSPRIYSATPIRSS